MTPPQEQAGLTNQLIAQVESLKARIAELEQGADELLAVWRNECDLRVKAEAALRHVTEELVKWKNRCDRGYDPEEEPATTEYWLGVRRVVDDLSALLRPEAQEEEQK